MGRGEGRWHHVALRIVVGLLLLIERGLGVVLLGILLGVLLGVLLPGHGSCLVLPVLDPFLNI